MRGVRGCPPRHRAAGRHSGSLGSVSSAVRMQGRTPRTPRVDPRMRKRSRDPTCPWRWLAFCHGCPAGPVHRSDDWAQVTSVVPRGSECSSSPSSPPTVARLRGEGAVRTAPTRGHQGAGRNAGAGEGGVHPGCPAHSLGLSPDYPMSPDRPGKGFPTALSETQNLGCGWGSGREAWHRGAVLPASLGPAPLLSSRTVTPVPPTCHQPQSRCQTPHGNGWHWGPGDGAHTWHPPPAPGTPAGLRAAGTLLWPAVGRP